MLTAGLAIGLAIGLTAGLALSGTWAVFLASVQMAITWHTPVRLLSFLADAHSRNVLRAVGPAYQFRHARLHDGLAAAASFRDDSLHAQISHARDRPAVALQEQSAQATWSSGEPNEPS